VHVWLGLACVGALSICFKSYHDNVSQQSSQGFSKSYTCFKDKVVEKEKEKLKKTHNRLDL
jgi:hypothetical protein